MPRLRVTFALSLLGLLGAIACTAWLSSSGGGFGSVDGPDMRSPAKPVRVPASGGAMAFASRHASTRHTRAAVAHADLEPEFRRADALQASARDPSVTGVALPKLRPLAMLADDSMPYAELRDHLDGQMHVRVDGTGNVTDAAVFVSSDDPLLDEHALRTVRRWRFAVPADWPDGFTGELPMRFLKTSLISVLNLFSEENLKETWLLCYI